MYFIVDPTRRLSYEDEKMTLGSPDVVDVVGGNALNHGISDGDALDRGSDTAVRLTGKTQSKGRLELFLEETDKKTVMAFLLIKS